MPSVSNSFAGEAHGPSASRPTSPSETQLDAEHLGMEDVITYHFIERDVVSRSPNLPTLIEHIHNGKHSPSTLKLLAQSYRGVRNTSLSSQ
jgi:hypothetical protein